MHHHHHHHHHALPQDPNRHLNRAEVEEYQTHLVALGHDLGHYGPHGDGVDGKYYRHDGKRSKTDIATESFIKSYAEHAAAIEEKYPQQKWNPHSFHSVAKAAKWAAEHTDEWDNMTHAHGSATPAAVAPAAKDMGDNALIPERVAKIKAALDAHPKNTYLSIAPGASPARDASGPASAAAQPAGDPISNLGKICSLDPALLDKAAAYASDPANKSVIKAYAPMIPGLLGITAEQADNVDSIPQAQLPQVCNNAKSLLSRIP